MREEIISNDLFMKKELAENDRQLRFALDLNDAEAKVTVEAAVNRNNDILSVHERNLRGANYKDKFAEMDNLMAPDWEGSDTKRPCVARNVASLHCALMGSQANGRA